MVIALITDLHDKRKSAMTIRQIEHEIEGLLMAGWYRFGANGWKHPHIGGIHNLRSAILATSRMVNR